MRTKRKVIMKKEIKKFLSLTPANIIACECDLKKKREARLISIFSDKKGVKIVS